MKQETLIAYGMSGASYLVENFQCIRNIILFGSVARGKFDSQSDVDIFVDIPEFSKKKEQEIKKILQNFEKTEVYEKWKLKGVKANIVPIIGNLKSKEWESLYLSICSDGISFYGKYQSAPSRLKHHVIFSLDPVKNEKKRVNAYRKLFGYRIEKRQYPGTVLKANGKKLGPNVFIVPVEDSKKIRELLEKMSITPKMLEVWL